MRPCIILIGGTTICLACTGAADGPPQSGSAEWELVEDLRLDANVEDFSLVGQLYVGPRNEIIVPEPQDHRLRLYDSTGTLVAMIGGRGSGPGEFQHVGVGFWAADTLVVWDGRLGRVTLLLNGNLVRTEVVQLFRPFWGTGADSTFFAFIPEAVNHEGAMMGLAYLGVSGRRESTRVVVRVGHEGEPNVLALPPQYNDERWSVTVSGVTNSVPFAFRSRTTFASDGSRFLFVTADQSRRHGTYDLTMLRSTGDTIFSRSYAYDGEMIPDSALDRAIAAMTSESGRDRRARELARERAPAVYAPIGNVTIGLDGTVWVELRSEDRDRGTPVVVLSEAGDSIGSLRLPMRTKIRQASMTHVWVTETDALDLASVVRYRLASPTAR